MQNETLFRLSRLAHGSRLNDNFRPVVHDFPKLFDLDIADRNTAIGPVVRKAFHRRPIWLAVNKNIPARRLAARLGISFVYGIRVG